ncbi:MAG: hypothetical protein ACSLFQ_10650 [Thermoanaerobaculia bacterium]
MRPTSTTSPSPEPRKGSRTLPVVAVTASALFFFTLLLERVWSNSVDVVFWDQWDYFDPTFKGEGLWSVFRQQFGPCRQGLGGLVITASNALSGWDTRVLSVVTVCLLLVAMLVAVRLKVVLYGELTVWDALIPPLFFRLSQSLAIASIAFPTHGALPIILILFGCLILSVESRKRQLLILTPFAFVAVHTGFANLFLPVLAGILLFRGIAELLKGKRSTAALTAFTTLAVVLMSLTFLFGFISSNIALECEDKATGGIRDYLAWIVTQVSQYWGAADLNFPPLVAILLIIGLLSCLAVASAQSVRREESTDSMRQWARYAVPLALISYSLVFSLASAWGRICGGSGYALSSRYVTHMIPLGLGLFFAWLIVLRGAEGRRLTKHGAISVGVLLAAGIVWGATYDSSADRFATELEIRGKVRWAECVRRGGSAVECSAQTHFLAYPYPDLLDSRIDYLRERKLSFFSDDWSVPDSGSDAP